MGYGSRALIDGGGVGGVYGRVSIDGDAVDY